MELQADDIGNDIAAAISAAETPPPAESKPGDAQPSEPPADAPSAAPEASEGERARDDKGRFVAKTDAPQTDAPKTEAKPAETPATEQTPATAAQQPVQGERIAPPLNWRGQGKVAWDKLPRVVQQELSDDYKRFTDSETQFANLRKVLSPVEENWRLTYGSTEAGLHDLLQKAQVASKRPADFIVWLAQANQIDLGALHQQLTGQGGASAQPTQGAPMLSPDQIRQMARQAFEQEQAQHRQAQAQNDIEAFARDPAHPYFNDVRQHMAALMQSGAAKSMQDAYDSACWANPQIRAALISQETERKAADAAEAERQRVANARKANGSISGSPAGASVAKEEPSQDLETSVRKLVEARVS